MSISDHDAAETARAYIGHASDALDGVKIHGFNISQRAKESAPAKADTPPQRLDRAGELVGSAAIGGFGAARAAVTRARATYARDPRKTILVTGAVALGIVVLTSLLRRS